MATPSARPDLKYLPCHCPFLNKEVWAILVRQSDGSWKIANCLDKDQPCFQYECAFTTDGGEWPFKVSGLQDRRPA